MRIYGGNDLSYKQGTTLPLLLALEGDISGTWLSWGSGQGSARLRTSDNQFWPTEFSGRQYLDSL